MGIQSLTPKSSGWTKLGEITLATNQAININNTFTGLSGYRALRIVFGTKGTTSGGTGDLNIRFNGQGTNYYGGYFSGATYHALQSSTSILLSSAISQTLTSYPTGGYIDITNIPSLDKVATADYVAQGTPTSVIVGLVLASAINQIDIYATTNGLGSGSTFTLYGIV